MIVTDKAAIRRLVAVKELRVELVACRGFPRPVAATAIAARSGCPTARLTWFIAMPMAMAASRRRAGSGSAKAS